MINILIFLAVSFFFFSQAVASEVVDEEEYWINDVLILDSQTNSFKSGAIRVDDGKIQAIASQIPHSADDVFSFKGLYAIPGLINAHVHVLSTPACRPGYGFTSTGVLQNLHSWIVSGFTTIADMGGWPEMLSKIRHWTDEEPHVGPRIRMAGPIITTEKGYPDNWMPRVARTIEALRFLDEARVDELVNTLRHLRVDHVKIALQEISYGGNLIPTIPLPVLTRFIDKVHQNGLKVYAHALTQAGYRMGLKAGVDAFIHGPQEHLSDEILRLIVKKHVAIIPTVWVWKSPWHVPDNNIDPVHFSKGVDKKILESWTKYLRDYGSGELFPGYLVNEPGILKSRTRRRIRDLISNLRRMRQAGADFVFGTDAPYCFNTAGSSYREMVELKQAGFTNREILQMATINAARFLGIDRETGRLEPGLRADIVLLEKNPLEDLTALEKPAHVFRDGEEIEIDKDVPLDDKIKIKFLLAGSIARMGGKKIESLIEEVEKD